MVLPLSSNINLSVTLGQSFTLINLSVTLGLYLDIYHTLEPIDEIHNKSFTIHQSVLSSLLDKVGPHNILYF